VPEAAAEQRLYAAGRRRWRLWQHGKEATTAQLVEGSRAPRRPAATSRWRGAHRSDGEDRGRSSGEGYSRGTTVEKAGERRDGEEGERERAVERRQAGGTVEMVERGRWLTTLQ
jgi:hypothetical protein